MPTYSNPNLQAFRQAGQRNLALGRARPNRRTSLPIAEPPETISLDELNACARTLPELAILVHLRLENLSDYTTTCINLPPPPKRQPPDRPWSPNYDPDLDQAGFLVSRLAELDQAIRSYHYQLTVPWPLRDYGPRPTKETIKPEPPVRFVPPPLPIISNYFHSNLVNAPLTGANLGPAERNYRKSLTTPPQESILDRLRAADLESNLLPLADFKTYKAEIDQLLEIRSRLRSALAQRLHAANRPDLPAEATEAIQHSCSFSPVPDAAATPPEMLHAYRKMERKLKVRYLAELQQTKT